MKNLSLRRAVFVYCLDVVYEWRHKGWEGDNQTVKERASQAKRTETKGLRQHRAASGEQTAAAQQGERRTEWGQRELLRQDHAKPRRAC